ncbi:MAG: cobalt-precorrin-5B (C(1))-methyltransferase, partial [Spirochaetales bacterium]|nr:cobalt-precorrin-5B (C(1))-methyltransferase [Spirochaetales bacterium]
MVPSYRQVLGKVEGLQRGFTSGTCAQAASKAAAQMLLTGEICQDVTVTLKGGLELTIPVTGQELREDSASCGIIKDSGDDT